MNTTKKAAHFVDTSIFQGVVQFDSPTGEFRIMDHGVYERKYGEDCFIFQMKLPQRIESSGIESIYDYFMEESYMEESYMEESYMEDWFMENS